MFYRKVLALIFTLFFSSGIANAQDADCYDKGEDYFIPAKDLLDAKKKALLCFFANISIRSSAKEGNKNVDFEQETNLQAKSANIDWSGLKKSADGIYRWPAKDVNENIKKLHDLNQDKKTIPVEKEIQETWNPSEIKKSIVSIQSVPSGATVALDGVEDYCVTPCKKEILQGVHTVTLWKQDYSRLTAPLDVKVSEGEFEYKLKTNIGRISLSDCPSRTSILLDSNQYGVTPLAEIKTAPGSYVLTLEHPEYFKRSEKLFVKVGETTNIECGLKPKEGAVSLSAKDSKGAPVKAKVFIDGENVGATPGTFKTRIGARELKVVKGEEAWEDKIVVEKSKTTEITASLKPILSEEQKEWRRMETPLSLSIDWGMVSESTALHKKSGVELKQPDSNSSQSNSNGGESEDTSYDFQLNLSWKFSKYFGVNASYLTSQYSIEGVQQMRVVGSYSSNYKQLQYKVDLNYATLGVRFYPFFGPIKDGDATKGAIGFLDLGVSYLVSSTLSLTEKGTNKTWKKADSGDGVVFDITLVSGVAQKFYMRFLNVALLPTFKTDEKSDLGDFKGIYIFNIVGLGYRF